MKNSTKQFKRSFCVEKKPWVPVLSLQVWIEKAEKLFAFTDVLDWLNFSVWNYSSWRCI